MYPPGKETRLIVDDELVWVFRQLEHLEAEGLENMRRLFVAYPIE